MGWLYQRRPANVKQFIKDTYEKKFSDGSRTKFTVLDIAMKNFGKVAYIAIRNEETKEVSAVVWLLDYTRGQMGYKDIDENMGPCECDCPERILKLLTPTDYEYARNWRQRCYYLIGNRRFGNAT
jgi:hypothetical protein